MVVAQQAAVTGSQNAQAQADNALAISNQQMANMQYMNSFNVANAQLAQSGGTAVELQL